MSLNQQNVLCPCLVTVSCVGQLVAVYPRGMLEVRSDCKWSSTCSLEDTQLLHLSAGAFQLLLVHPVYSGCFFCLPLRMCVTGIRNSGRCVYVCAGLSVGGWGCSVMHGWCHWHHCHTYTHSHRNSWSSHYPHGTGCIPELSTSLAVSAYLGPHYWRTPGTTTRTPSLPTPLTMEHRGGSRRKGKMQSYSICSGSHWFV